MCRSLAFLVILCCLTFAVASPTRRKFVSYDTETSSDPSVVVTDDGDSWDDSDDDFDLEGDGWMKEVSAAPPSPLPYDYEDYDGEEDSEVEQSRTNPNTKPQDSEFLFLSPKETRLVLEDDDDAQSGLIKVRHSSKNNFPEAQEDESENLIEDSSADQNGQFVFTIDEDEDNKIDSGDDSKDDDFVLDDSSSSDSKTKNKAPQREFRDDADDNDDDDVDDDSDDDDDNDDDSNLVDGDGDSMFESPEEEAQVIYGDHVFLY